MSNHTRLHGSNQGVFATLTLAGRAGTWSEGSSRDTTLLIIVVSLLLAWAAVRWWREILTLALVLAVALICAGALSIASFVR